MIWSITKVTLFFALAAALAWGASRLLGSTGDVLIAFGGREYAFSPLTLSLIVIAALAVLWLVLRLLALLWAVVRFLSGDETAISRYWDRNRERRGFEALTEGLIALSAGEGSVAAARAARAEQMLDRPELTGLLSAQAAEMNGETGKAAGYYKDMMTSERTRFTGIRGLMNARVAAGDNEAALKLAEKAVAMKPRHAETLDLMFRLQTGKGDWTGARKTLEAKLRSKSLPRDVATRRDAVLTLAHAQEALASGGGADARQEALDANRKAPGLVPAAVLAADQHLLTGNKRAAGKVLQKAWALNAHPDLAAAYARIAPEESAEARRKRFATLFRAGPISAETQMLEAELALTCEDFPGARRAIGDLATTHPTTRALAIMAAIERGEGSDDTAVRGWLAKALLAPRGSQWICDKCGRAHGDWAAVCSGCGAFDALAWKEAPPVTTADATTAAMLPLIIGASEASLPEPPAESLADRAETA